MAGGVSDGQSDRVERPLLRQAAYLRWLVSDTGVALASAVESFVLPLLVIVLTRDPALAGTVAALGTGARLVTTLLGGVLADRHDLRRLMVLSGAAGSALVALMGVAYSGGMGVAVLAVLALFSGARAGLLGVASNAALKQVVPPAQLPTASSANQARDAGVQLGGGPLAGALLAFGALVALGSAALSYLLAALAALTLRGDFRPDRPETSASSAWREAAEGIGWLWARGELRRILVVSLLLNLGLSATVTTLIYDLGVRGVDPSRIGLVSSVLGAGMLIGASAAATVVSRFPSGWVAVTGMTMVGVAVMVLPWVTPFWATLAVLFTGILGAPACNAAMMSYFMHLVPRRLLGRALSGASLLSGGATPLAPVLAGLGLAWLGLRPTLIVAGAICLVAVLVLVTDRGLRNLPRPADWPETPAANDGGTRAKTGTA